MSTQKNWTILLLALGVFMTATAAVLQGNDGSTPETLSAEENKALALKKENEQFRRDIAVLTKERIEAEKAAKQALLPTSSTSGPAGSVTLAEKGGYYAEVMAYETLTEAAAAIATKVPAPSGVKDPTVIVTTETDFSGSAQLWHMVDLHLEDFEAKLSDLIKDARAIRSSDNLITQKTAGALVAAVPGMLGAAADVASFFRTDLTITGREVSLAESALVAEVARHLAAGKTDAGGTKWSQVIVPSLYLREKGPMTVRVGELLKLHRDLAAQRERVRKVVETEIAHQADVMKQLDREDGGTANLRELEREAQRVKSKWSDLEGSIDDVLAAVSTYLDTLTDVDGDEPAPLTTLRHVDLILGNPTATVVAIEIVSQGSEVHVSKAAWKTRLSFFGGSVSTYFVIGPDNNLIASGTVPVVRSESVTAKKSRLLAIGP